jgi:hypothetical protein
VSDRNLVAVAKVLLALSVLLLGANSALAYVGPGADLAFVSYAMALLAWALAAFTAVLLWPVYALLRKIRGGKKESTTAPALDKAPDSVGQGDKVTR